MIKYTDQSKLVNRLFKTPFQQKLNPKNRWMQLEQIVPWDQMAEVFIKRLDRYQGRASVDLRIVMGAMYIQHSLNLTDRETIQSIQENIYMQYFVGLSSFQTKAVFDHSLLAVFRNRLGRKGSKELADIFINYAIDQKMIKHRKSRKSKGQEDGSNDDPNQSVDSDDPTSADTEEPQQNEPSETKNRGTVKIDATVVPQNITYPTDTKLLNHARKISEIIIDEVYEHAPELWDVKPRTYRKKARLKWLAFSKSRRPSKKKIKAQKKADLGFLRRNLRYIEQMMELLLQNGIRIQLTEELRKKLYVISEVYRQQKIMYDDNRKKISDRIVNIAQPWIRPIVRGKAGSPVEFGAKINVSLTENMISVDQSHFDAYNESKYFEQQIESYKSKFGYYPEFALIDKIYLTRANRAYMKQKGIRHTGSPLGRPAKNQTPLTKASKKKNNERNHVEGKFGQAKTKFGWDNLRTKKKSTSYCAINLIALMMNMLALQKRAFCLKITQFYPTLQEYYYLYLSKTNIVTNIKIGRR